MLSPGDWSARGWFHGGSGLQTAIVGIIEDRDQEIAPTTLVWERSSTAIFHLTFSEPAPALVLVTVRLERPFHLHANVLGLIDAQLRHHTTKPLHHQRSDLFVKFFRQYFNRNR